MNFSFACVSLLLAPVFTTAKLSGTSVNKYKHQLDERHLAGRESVARRLTGHGDSSSSNDGNVGFLSDQKTFLSALGKLDAGADLGLGLSGDQPFTVFAPTDDAVAEFQAHPFGEKKGLFACLLHENNKAFLSDFLKYHVVGSDDRILKEQLLEINWNLISRLVDFPLAVSSSKEFDTVEINGSKVVSADVLLRKGVMHGIESVLVPLPFDASKISEIFGNCDVGDISATITEADMFKELLDKAVDLDGEGLYTVFAPVDTAFEATPTLFDCLLRDENTDALLSFVKNHIVSDSLFLLSTDLLNGMKATTIQGDEITVNLSWDSTDSKLATINDSNVSKSVLASNGAIHLINDVLLHSNFNVNALLAQCAASLKQELKVKGDKGGILTSDKEAILSF
jgi:uncharacterized surface protein with fasciclin (FAS1) repeats